MTRTVFLRIGFLSILILFVGGAVSGQDAAKPSESDASKFIYADFQNVQTGRPVSKHGGMTRLNHYSQNEANPPRGSGNCCGSSASRPTVYSDPMNELNVAIRERNTTSGFVFSHVITMLFGPIRHSRAVVPIGTRGGGNVAGLKISLVMLFSPQLLRGR